MRALISVDDETGLADFARGLREIDTEIVADEENHAFLTQNGIDCAPLAAVTGTFCALDGQVQLYHPAVFAGILADRGNAAHNLSLQEQGVDPFDLVVVNLPPLSEEEETPALIDVGRQAVVQAGAENPADVTIVVDPADYEDVLAELFRYRATRAKTRQTLAAKALSLAASRDAKRAARLQQKLGQAFPGTFTIPLYKLYDLRYGENLHQSAALYSTTDSASAQPISSARQLQGKELSFNNLLDLDAAWSMASDFSAPTVSIVRHTNPIGLAAGRDVRDAFQKAFGADSQSAYGGIVGFNREVDEATAEEIALLYFEAIIAPGYSPEALQILGRKRAIRLLDAGGARGAAEDAPYMSLDFKRISGGFLAQSQNIASNATASMQVVTKRQPTLEELTDLQFAWRAVRHVKSNGVLLVRKLAVTGVGAGQMSRSGAINLACDMAGEHARGSVLASDAYLPFAEDVERVIHAGVTAIIQPGGSIKDKDVIEVADKAGVAMLFTGLRHLKH
ncbi:MAG: bifunctional phosphoribosylaminoimidazolecarboxamide formyltransferase/IMP cyclohydrolase [Chloroflexota bacterium]